MELLYIHLNGLSNSLFTFAFLLVTVVVQQSIGHLKMFLLFVCELCYGQRSPLIWRGGGIWGAREAEGGWGGPGQSAGGWRGGRGRC